MELRRGEVQERSKRETSKLSPGSLGSLGSGKTAVSKVTSTRAERSNERELFPCPAVDLAADQERPIPSSPSRSTGGTRMLTLRRGIAVWTAGGCRHGAHGGGWTSTDGGREQRGRRNLCDLGQPQAQESTGTRIRTPGLLFRASLKKETDTHMHIVAENHSKPMFFRPSVYDNETTHAAHSIGGNSSK